MVLTEILFLNGLLSLIISLFAIFIGLYIASKYRKYNNKNLLYVGAAWFGLTNGYWPYAINFILIISTGSSLSEVSYFIIANASIPWWLFLWMVAVTNLCYKQKQKPILLVFFIFGLIYNSVLFFYAFTDPSRIGILTGPFDVKYIGLIALFLVSAIILAGITGVLVALELLKSDNPRNRLKGWFLLYAFVSWAISVILDASLQLTIISLVVIRLILISSSISFYFGFLLPKWIKKS